jgi:putative heme-binding domain-containing protein
MFAEHALIKTLTDDNGQAAMYAAIGLGKIGSNQAVNTVINKLIQVADKDLWLRHALVMALKGIDKKYWIQHKKHKSPEVRLALLLALRALNDEQVADFLHDGTQAIVDEAILAIDDKKLTKVRPKVAALLNPELRADTAVQALVHHRIINANFNEGRAEDASRLLAYAGHKGLAQRLVSEALAAIEAWTDINPIDTVSGLPSLANHTRATIDALVVQYLPDILANTKGQALVQGMRIAQKYNHKLSAAELTKITQDPSADVDIRMQALDLLSVSYPIKAIGVSEGLLKNNVLKLKAAALGVLLQQDYQSGIHVLFDFLASDSIPLQKIALAKMSAQSNAQIDDLLVSKLEALLHNQGENAITLELLSAVQKSTNARLKTLLTEYQNKMQNSDVLTQFAGALAGGDAQVGRTLFFTDGAANCIRCHQINGEGANVGPDLSDIGKTHSAEYLLQALVDPGATIAPGYGTFNLTMHDDKVLSGLFYAETDSTITLGKSGEKLQVFNKSDIKHIQRSASGMPPMNYMLTPAQIRDVVAYLESLKGKGEQVPTAHH